ncbi:MAG: S9 family peptidase, partial [Cyanobacteria bacterium HKST-UBA05]|nr:S9 family peptidase [Cyanobacteria bacterium HKST-UBA05]
VAYCTSEAGSDMATMHVRRVADGTDLPDTLTNLRHSDATWDLDASGFVYALPVSPNGTPDPTGKRRAVYHHTLGAAQHDDVKLFERADLAASWVSAFRITEDDAMLFISVGNGTNPENGLYFRAAHADNHDPSFTEILKEDVAAVHPFWRDGQTLYAITDLDAPRNRIVTINLDHPTPDHWQTVVAESDDEGTKLDGAFVANVGVETKLFVLWTVAGASELDICSLDGSATGQVDVPVASSISLGQVRPNDTDFLLSVNSYLTPGTQYRYTIATNELSVYKHSGIARDLTGTATVERLMATSADGAQVPMWVIYPNTLKRDGNAACLLYGYGGFNISLNPGFSFDIMHWVESGGVYVVSNLRGGGELGKSWNEGGKLGHKQNVFNDFAACAETLITFGFTRPDRLAVYGGSNGGLLTATVAQQRPDLFGAVISAVPVTDMLRYGTHGIGMYWQSDYGDTVNDEAAFRTAMAYSPLHNVKPASTRPYPPTLIMTADHDDRVAPWHAYKLLATLQAAGHHNTWLRLEERAGHGAGKPTEKVIENSADRMAFLELTLGKV